MYDLSFVKKRRKRRLVAFGSLVSAIGISSLVMVSFLGRNVGAYTITLTNSLVKLALSQKSDFIDQTSYLRIEGVKQFEETTYSYLPEDQELDSEETPSTLGLNGDPEKGRYEFFKSTYYVKNVGNISANYTMDVNIGKIRISDDGTNRTLDETARIMVYENSPEESAHNKRIFAKAAKENNVDELGNPTNREFVSNSANMEDDTHPLAETFYSSSIVARYEVNDFEMNEVMRYTVVIWLEGADPQAGGSVPEGASIEFGVKISAHES